ncbi:hypothetical protein HB779_21505 (plasmid) [Phyllobacterium sp. 628]|uniref:antibiotic biosynthesis monooxygenase family protein n=1 Tax=Phyllobacterium sp. 628 TaxID=2718938 RepID=UPI0016622E51|nr:antibiotic biosynthesis monooxygenase family protein [Phyllobacterium sp. 628]QND54494.1 hypothetical protein HB779_21505 [Phyllobacterium sp. 628]
MISSVTVTVMVEIRPDAWSGYLKHLSDLLKDARTFPGLQDIRVVEHKQQPNKILFIEKWNTEADYDAYVSHCAIHDHAKAFRTLCVGEPFKDVWAVDISGT